MSAADAIIVGIDFGTTYSGVAWTRARSNTISLVTSWESSDSIISTEAKVPSKLVLEKGSNNSSSILWGYNTPLGKQTMEWFKIMQLEADDVPEHIKTAPKYFEASMLMYDLDCTPSSILATFLKSLWRHARMSIERSVGAACLKSCDLQFVLTIPASWPHYVKERYKAAAQAAGMLDRQSNGRVPTLRFISEPEAAALATLQDVATQPDIKDGDSFIICDAGGGTVDVITYIIKNGQLREAVEGEGALCGAMNLDHRFRALMKSRLAPGSFDSLDESAERRFLKYEWHDILKLGFRDDGTNRTWSVNLPEGCHAQGTQLKRRGTMALTSTEIKEAVFEPVVSDVLGLLQRQQQAVVRKYAKQPTHIILVGGFGRNQYLYNRIASTFSNTVVLQSEGKDPWTAICRGAVLYGLTKTDQRQRVRTRIGSRVARHSYGVKYSADWDPFRHKVEHKYWNDLTGKWKVQNQMKWFIKKGDNIDSMEPIELPFNTKHTGKIGQKTSNFFISSEDVPSPHLDNTVHKLCTVKWSRTIHAQDLPKRSGYNGQSYRQVDYLTRMTVTGPSIEFATIYKGKEVASHETEVEYPVKMEAEH